MDIAKHKEEFDSIVEKYGLRDESKALEIAEFLTSHKEESVSAKEFADLFAMTPSEAVIFLSFIQRGIRFKEEHIDPHQKS
jgi:hypothetical protein